MLSVDMTSLWGDDNEKIVKGVSEATNNIVLYRKSRNISEVMFEALLEDITVICCFWTGNTYIGCAKESVVKNAFQSFFEELMNLLLVMKSSNRDYEATFADKLLYRGKIYRYLGNASPSDDIVKPVFDGVYVSWDKEPENWYITSKLYGTITWLSCEISAPFYGIDLDNLGCLRANEHEVVFPTIEKCITEIKYISEEDNDKT